MPINQKEFIRKALAFEGGAKQVNQAQAEDLWGWLAILLDEMSPEQQRDTIARKAAAKRAALGKQAKRTIKPAPKRGTITPAVARRAVKAVLGREGK